MLARDDDIFIVRFIVLDSPRVVPFLSDFPILSVAGLYRKSPT